MTPGRWWPGGDLQVDRVALSALEHHAYCARQAALIHLDGVFTDNVETARGNVAHSRVHAEPARHRAPVPAGGRHLTGVQVWSERLGLYGVCDVVEVTRERVVPIEHKVGRYVPGGPADIQAAAQAICLAEMQALPVPHAVVYSFAERRRHTVELTAGLVGRVESTAEAVRTTLAGSSLPRAAADRRCRACSLRADCLPDLDPQHAADVDLFLPRPLGHWEG